MDMRTQRKGNPCRSGLLRSVAWLSVVALIGLVAGDIVTVQAQEEGPPKRRPQGDTARQKAALAPAAVGLPASPLPLGYRNQDFHVRLVDLFDGRFQVAFQDVAIPAPSFPLEVRRHYRSGSPVQSVFGLGWTWNLGMRVYEREGSIAVVEADGRLTGYFSSTGSEYKDALGQSVLTRHEEPEAGYSRAFADGRLERYDELGRLTSIGDETHSGRLRLIYGEDDLASRPVRVTDLAGRSITFEYSKGKLVRITDPIGRELAYAYEDNNLIGVKDALDRNIRLTYSSAGLEKMTLPKGTRLRVTYAADGSVAKLEGPGARVTSFERTADESNVTNSLRIKHGNGARQLITVERIFNQERNVGQGRVETPTIRLSIANGDDAASAMQFTATELLVEDPYKNQLRLKKGSRGQIEPATEGRGGDTGVRQQLSAVQLAVASRIGELLDLESFGGWEKASFEFDKYGNPVRLVMNAGDSFSLRFDRVGRLLAVTHNSKREQSYEWDGADRLVKSRDLQAVVYEYAYDAHDNLTALPDGRGHFERFRHNEMDLVDVHKDVLGNETHVEYDAYGNIVEQRDVRGNTARFSYDEANRLTERMVPGEGRTRYVYNGKGKLGKIITPRGSEILYEYNDRGQPIMVTDVLGRITSYSYGSKAELTRVVFPNGSNRGYSYADDKIEIRTEHPDGSTHTRSLPRHQNAEPAVMGPDGLSKTKPAVEGFQNIYDEYGELAAIIRRDGTRAEFARDSFGRPVRFKDLRGNITEYSYDQWGNVSLIVHPTGWKESYRYDRYGRIVEVVQSGDGTESKTTYAYNGLGDLLSVTYPDLTSERYRYDRAGRIDEMIDRLGNPIRYTYDRSGRLTATESAYGKVSQRYDKTGALVEESDPISGIVRWKYSGSKVVTRVDPLGRETTTELDEHFRPAALVDALGGKSLLEYDSGGRLVRYRGPGDADGNAWVFKYDAGGNLLQAVTPLEKVTQDKYDQDGRKVETRLPSGATIEYEYDDYGEVRRVRYSDGSSVTYNRDRFGRVSTVVDGVGTHEYEYDVFDRVVRYRDPFGRSIRYSYDTGGRKTIVSAGEGQTSTYSYDQRGLLAEIKTASGAIRFTYDNVGRRILVRYPDGLTTNYEYNGNSRVQSIRYGRKDGSVVLRVEYEYDAAGNPIAITDSDFGRRRYKYDVLNRLVEASYPGGGVEQFSYDLAGNITKTSDILAWEYDAENKLLKRGDGSLIYDLNGNLIEMAGHMRLQFQVDGRLAQVVTPGGEAAEYLYDYLGRRVQKTVGSRSTRFLYDGDNVIAEYNGQGKNSAFYTLGLGIDQVVGVIVGGEEFYYLRDAVGSVLALVNKQGEVVNRYGYRSYGKGREAQEQIPNRYRFVGREFDGESGLYYMRARYYAPSLSRFLSPDPIFSPDTITEPGGANPYLYVSANPNRFVDPRGEALEDTSTFVPPPDPSGVTGRVRYPPDPKVHSILGGGPNRVGSSTSPILQDYLNRNYVGRLTQSVELHQGVGTVNYMSPEQAEFWGLVVYEEGIRPEPPVVRMSVAQRRSLLLAAEGMVRSGIHPRAAVAIAQWEVVIKGLTPEQAMVHGLIRNNVSLKDVSAVTGISRWRAKHMLYEALVKSQNATPAQARRGVQSYTGKGVSRIGHAAYRAGGAFRSTVGRATSVGRRVVGAARSGAGRVGRAVGQTIRANPLGSVLVGATVGMFAYDAYHGGIAHGAARQVPFLSQTKSWWEQAAQRVREVAAAIGGGTDEVRASQIPPCPKELGMAGALNRAMGKCRDMKSLRELEALPTVD